MKKVILLSGVVALLLFASCKDKKENTPPATPPPVESPAPPPAPEPTVQEENKDGTSVSINQDGVSIENKDGEKESNVTITDKKKEINIKTD